MKKTKILALLLVSALLVSMLASCGTEKVIANITLSVTVNQVYPDDENLVTNYEIEVQGTADNPPTVLQALTEALFMLEIPLTLNSAETSVVGIGDYTEYVEGDVTYYWDYKINGETPTTGKAADNVIKEGDILIFEFIKFNKNDIKD